MSREPCMTLKELARTKGVSQQSLSARCKKHPLPAAVTFEDNRLKAIHLATRQLAKVRQFRRSELLAWYEGFSQ